MSLGQISVQGCAALEDGELVGIAAARLRSCWMIEVLATGQQEPYSAAKVSLPMLCLSNQS
jgi:hypothetical protein